MAAAETVHITQNQSKEQDLSGTMWGEETNPSLLSTVPGGYRNVTLGISLDTSRGMLSSVFQKVMMTDSS